MRTRLPLLRYGRAEMRPSEDKAVNYDMFLSMQVTLFQCHKLSNT